MRIKTKLLLPALAIVAMLPEVSANIAVANR
jgi:hypothetical protein